MNEWQITWLLLLDNMRDHAVFLSGFFVAIIIFIVYRRRNNVERRKVGSSKTPPGSVSPIVSGKAKGFGLHIIPPSRRNTFEVTADDVSSPVARTKEEIEALGDFPDYAALSGVRLPKPYPEFDIKTAKPRPYRPFRWAYHQTMCKFQNTLHDCEA